MKLSRLSLVSFLGTIGLLAGLVCAAIEPLQDLEAALAAPSPAGKARFETVCSGCHGIQARGGRGGAPDLLMSPLVLGKADRFKEFVRAGSPNGMPGFSFDDETLSSLHNYLGALASTARRRGVREIAIVGNAGRGKSYFEGAGHCHGCHSPSGDLAGIGTRYNPRVLQGRIVLPRGNGVHPGLTALGVKIPGVTDEKPVVDVPRTVNVTDEHGHTIRGTLLHVSDFDVSLRDDGGGYRSFARHQDKPKIEIFDPSQPHLDRLGQINDQDIHDLTAYLATLK